jgi:hypothetical protein
LIFGELWSCFDCDLLKKVQFLHRPKDNTKTKHHPPPTTTLTLHTNLFLAALIHPQSSKMPPHSATDSIDIDVMGCATQEFESPSSKIMPSPRSIERRRATRSVSFAPRHHFRETINREDFTADEKAAVWFCDEEYAIIKCQVRSTVCRWEQGITLSEGEDNMRGLEWKTSLGMQRRFMNQTQAVKAVLDEQERQDIFEGGVRDPIRISHAYLPISSQSASTAHLMALDDQRQARASDNANTTNGASMNTQARKNRPQRRLSCTAA